MTLLYFISQKYLKGWEGGWVVGLHLCRSETGIFAVCFYVHVLLKKCQIPTVVIYKIQRFFLYQDLQPDQNDPTYKGKDQEKCRDRS